MMIEKLSYYLALLISVALASPKAYAATSYYKVTSEEEVQNPTKIYYSEAKTVKGRYFALKYAHDDPYENYFFKTFELMNQFLLHRHYIGQDELQKASPIIKIALELMKKQKEEVSEIRDLGANKSPLHTQFESFINSPYYWFYSSSHQELNGYISGGTGLNFCNGKFDMTWGLDCSGFVYFAHRLNKTCFPRFRSDNLWVLHNPSFGDSYDMYDYETLSDFFEETNQPSPGDLVLFDGHISLYLNDRLSIGQSSYGIAFEQFRNRKLTKENVDGIKPQHAFFKVKQKHANQCNDITVDRFRKENYKGSKKAYNKHFQGLYFNRETDNVVLNDYRGNGIGVSLCPTFEPTNESSYPNIEDFGDFGIFHKLREQTSQPVSSYYDILCQDDELVTGVKFKDHGDKHVLGIYCQKTKHERVGETEYIKNNNLPGNYYDRKCTNKGAVVVGIRFYESPTGSDSRMQGFYCQNTSHPSPEGPSYQVKVDDLTGKQYGSWCKQGGRLVGFGYKDSGDDHIMHQLCTQD
ncbi:MAG: C40 family peptidase [Oligoflexales bacterium]|nr:C40 family peptidase [Oligoflexales bacterium]